MVDPALTYAYVAYPDIEQIILGAELNYRDGWIGATTYYQYDAVTWNNDDYMALMTNSNVVPGTDPTQWSILVALEAAQAPSLASVYVVATSGSNLAYAILNGSYFLANGTDTVLCHNIAWGTEQDQVNASQVPYSDPTYQTVSEALDYLLTTSGTAGIAAEAGTRSQEDQNLQNQITGFTASIVTEQGTRSQEDQNLQNQITGFTASIVTEQGTRSQEDQNLQNQITGFTASIVTEQGTRSQEDQNLQNQIFTEQGTRSIEDQYIQNQINTVDTALVVEQGTRSSEDQALLNLIIAISGTANVAAEAGTRSSEDQNLQNQITSLNASIITEHGTRSSEDQNLQNQITVNAAGLVTEQGTRSSEDQNLQNQITYQSGNVLSSVNLSGSSGTIVLDFNGSHFQIVTLINAGTFVSANRQTGATLTALVETNGTAQSVSFHPSWLWINTTYTSPTTLVANKYGIISLTSFGTNESNVFVVYGPSQ